MSANGITMESGTSTNTKEPEVVEEIESGADLISRLCYEHGLFCATHPKLVIFFAALVILTCSAPLLSVPLFGGSAAIEWIMLSSSGVSVADSRASAPRILQGNDSTIPRWFVGDPVLYIQQFILVAHVSPWRPHLQSNMVIKEALKPAFQITKFISDFQYHHGRHTVELGDVCLKVDLGSNGAPLSGLGMNDQRYLPAKGCLLLSPANLWDRNIKRFEQDASVLDDLYLDRRGTAFNIGLSMLSTEFILGLPLKQTGIYPGIPEGPHHVIQYGMTLVLSSHDSRYIDELSKQLRKEFPLASPTEKDDGINKDNVVHIYYKGEHRELIELAPLCVTYFIVFLYLAFSVGKIEMVKSKWGLAFSAVISVIASLVMAAGLCSFFGLVTTLDSSEIFPYLVIVVGVENILVITKSVVSTPVDLEVKIRVAQGLSKEGWYIIKYLCTEVTVLVCGYITFVPAIQEFCVFALVCLLSDFFLQMVLFVTSLSIDIRRMELSDLQRQPIQVRERSRSDGSRKGSSPTSVQRPPSPVPSPPHSPQPVRFFGLLPPLPLFKLNTQSTPPKECPVLPKKLPKRLNFAYFWARTRIVQKALMVCVFIYFIYILSYPGSKSLDTSSGQQNSDKAAEDANLANSSSKFEDSKIKFTQGVEESSNQSGWTSTRESTGKRRTEFSIKPPSVELWKGLYQRHWPQLLNYYNISLLGRYVTVLPPVHLGINIDTDIFVPDMPQDGDQLLATNQDFPSVEATVKIDHPLGDGQGTGSSRDPEYYHNALSCVVLGVVVMIILFFVCKFLNDLQVNPRSGRGREGKGHRCDTLVESVPISLRGHTQNVEHLKCTVSYIVSVCLSGQICVWDIATGDCLRVINRKSPVHSDVPLKRKTKRKKPKHGRSVDTDSGYTTQRFLENLPSTIAHVIPGHVSDSECTPPQHLSTDDNGAEVSNGIYLSPKSESNPTEIGVVNNSCSLDESFASGGSPKSTGYDFSKYTNGMDIPTWSPRVSSRGSFTSSWSSTDEEDAGWLSSSEGSCDEQAYAQTDSFHHNRATGASVWCVDCKGDLLVTGCSDGAIEIWSVLSGAQVYVSRDGNIGVTKLSFLPGSPQIVVARLDGSLEFLSLGVPCRSSLNTPLLESSPIKRSSPRIPRKSNIHSNAVPGILHAEDSTPISVNGSHAYTSQESPLCRISHKLRAHHKPICALGVMEGRVITGSHDRTLKVFRTDECVCVYTLHGHADSISCLSVDKTNNRQVVSGAANGGVRVWDVVSGECLQHLRGHVKSVTAVTCTAEHLLSVSLESVLCIWDRARGECLHRLKQFPDLCSNVAMLSRTLFITGGQGHISVWDVLTGRRVKTVLLGDDDTSVFVRYVNVCDNTTVVCDYGKELKIVTFPAVMDKAE